MFDTDIHTLKDNLLKNNPIFGSNGFYYKNSLELAQNGVSDHFVNMFYIRPLNTKERKYTVKTDIGMKTITGTFRIVLQLSQKIEQPILAILSQLDYKVIGCNDDSNEVYNSEYKKEKTIDMFNLYLIDFEIMHETFYDCNTQKYLTTC